MIERPERQDAEGHACPREHARDRADRSITAADNDGVDLALPYSFAPPLCVFLDLGPLYEGKLGFDPVLREGGLERGLEGLLVTAADRARARIDDRGHLHRGGMSRSASALWPLPSQNQPR